MREQAGAHGLEVHFQDGPDGTLLLVQYFSGMARLRPDSKHFLYHQDTLRCWCGETVRLIGQLQEVQAQMRQFGTDHADCPKAVSDQEEMRSAS
jgi:hypothetical protein